MLPAAPKGGSSHQQGSGNMSSLSDTLGLETGHATAMRARAAAKRGGRQPMPGAADYSDDSDLDDSDDDGVGIGGARGGGTPEQAPKQAVKRRRPLPVAGVTSKGGAFRMMKMNTAVKPASGAAPSRAVAGPPRTPQQQVSRPRIAMSRPKGDSTPRSASPASSAGSGGMAGAGMSPFGGKPIAGAGAGLASPGDLMMYTKRKVAEIKARERMTLSRDGSARAPKDEGLGRARPTARAKVGFGPGAYDAGEASDSSEDTESDEDHDPDQLFLNELKKDKLSKQTKLILCFGFVGLMASFVVLFVILTLVTVNKECNGAHYPRTPVHANVDTAG